jgi:diadenosine tetraphosphate (Ap4A) HIT family hydrolase
MKNLVFLFLAFFVVTSIPIPIPTSTSTLSAKECAFCKPEVIEKQQVYQGKYWRILIDYQPVVKGHLLLVPIEHRRARHELTEEEHNELYKIEKIAHCILQKRFGRGVGDVEGIGDVEDVDGDVEDLQYEKNGATLQSVNHFHIHVIPIDKEMGSLWGRVKLAWALFTPRKTLTDEELEREKRESLEANCAHSKQ